MARLRSKSVAAAKASFNHEQGEAKVRLREGPNPLMLQNQGMTCG